MIDALGYLAGLFVVLTFYSTDLRTLRKFAIVSNLLFIAYALLLGLWPVLVLHSLLLPLNYQRLSDPEACFWLRRRQPQMTDEERRILERGLEFNPHCWALYGRQRTV
ncbi:MAG: hypothetical protein AAGA28_01040 [Pseudomonadota bacterium]